MSRRDDAGPDAPLESIDSGAHTLTLDEGAAAAPTPHAPAPATPRPAPPPSNPPSEPTAAIRDSVIDPMCYQFLGEVGRGGIGRVVRARDLRLGREVAVKELLGSSEKRRFRREAELTARLQHPSIVPVYEAGRWPSGEPFYAMKLVAGAPLTARLDAARTLAERLALLPHLIAVADAIAYAHGQGVIHRDLKPSNILLGDFGETIVIDWGLAKYVDESEAALPAVTGTAPHATMAGAVLGTPPYMSPEQARGEPVDERTDVYALGAILYHLLARRAPYEGPSADDVLADVVAQPPQQLEELAPDAPEDLCTIVHKAMARAPGARYPSARELSEDLHRFQTGQLVSAHHYGVWARARRWIGRHRRLVQASTLFAVALLVVGAIALRSVLRERARGERRRIEADAQREALHLMRARAALGSDPTLALRELLASRAATWDPGSVQDIAARAADSGLARATLRVDDATVAALAPGGLRYAVGSHDGYVRVFALDAAARTLARFQAHRDEVRALRWLDDNRLVSAAADGTVRLWDGAGNPRGELTRQAASVVRLQPSPDGRWLAVAGAAPTAQVVELAGGAVHDLRGHTAWVSDIQWSPDGRTLASGSEDGAVRLWDARSGESRVIGSHGAGVERVAFSPDGRWLASAGSDRSARLWPLGAGSARELGSHADWVNQVLWRSDGRRIITASGDGLVQLHEVDGAAPPVALRGHVGAVYDIALSPDGHVLATAGKDRTLRLWDAYTGAARALLRGHASELRDCAFGPDGRVVTLDFAGDVRVWDPAPARATWPAHDGMVTAIALGQDRVVSGGRDGQVRLWDRGGGDGRVVQRLGATVAYLALSPDGRTLAAADNAGHMQLSDLVSGGPPRELSRGVMVAPLLVTSQWLVGGGPRPFVMALADGSVTELPAAEIGVTRIALSPDGRRAAMLVRPDGLRLLELPATPLPVPGDIGRVSALGYAPDGTLLVGSDRVIALGPDGTRRELGRVETPLVELAVTADGTTAVGAVNGRALLWPMAGGARRQLELPSTVTPGPVEQADFLVFHDQDGLITVLRTADGALALHPVAGGGFPVVDLTGTMMVTGDLAGVIHVMDLTTQAFVPREPGALARWLVER